VFFALLGSELLLSGTGVVSTPPPNPLPQGEGENFFNFFFGAGVPGHFPQLSGFVFFVDGVEHQGGVGVGAAGADFCGDPYGFHEFLRRCTGA
jgi:hypothetical protein